MSKFKVGDEVRILGLALGYAGCYKKGDVGVIKVMDESDGYFKLNGDEATTRGWLKKAEAKYPNPPHVHADVIIEWAKGAYIQISAQGHWYRKENPRFDACCEYRIEPPAPAPTSSELADIKTQAKIDKLQNKIDKLKLTLEEK